MKVTLEKLIIAHNAGAALLKGKDLPVKLSYRLGMFEEKTSAFARQFKKQESKLIIEKYGIQEENEGIKTDNYKVPPDKLVDFNKEISDILSQEEDFDYTINLSLFDGLLIPKEYFRDMNVFIVE